MNLSRNSAHEGSAQQTGMLYAAIAYSTWILFPFFFKFLQSVPALEIMGHRLLWSQLFMLALLSANRRWGWLREALSNRRILAQYATAGVILAVNWLIYIYGVNSGHIVESSLGYFINPLVSVLMGVFLLHERLRPGQWLAILIAAAGVAYLTWGYGQPPWIALGLALSFGIYGLIKKTATLPAAEGLMLETALLAPFALLFLFYWEGSGRGHFLSAPLDIKLLLPLSGPITAIPLTLYAAGARRIPLSLLGILQYIAPIGQFLAGVLFYNEPFPPYKQVGFAIIWLALLIFTSEGLWMRRQQEQGAALLPAR